MKIIISSLKTTLLVSAFFILPLAGQAQSIWNAVAGTSTDTNWSSSVNWTPNGAPGSSANVLFNNTATAPNITTVNNYVDASFGGTIASLSYTNNTTGTFQNTVIADGTTLNVNGGMTVGGTTDPGPGVVTTTTISGASRLNLNTGSGNIYVAWGDITSATGPATLVMSNLDLFTATISRILIGQPGVNRASGNVFLAKTNTITLSNTGTGTGAALIVGDNGSNNGNPSTLNLGLTNGIFADNIGAGLRKQNNSSGLRFNPAFTNNSPTAYFRGQNGTSAVANWNLGDGNGASATVTSTGYSDFSGGTVDALVNTMIMARCATAATGGRTANATLTMAAGNFSVSIITNAQLVTANGETATGTINVRGGTFEVKNTLAMAALNGFTPGTANSTLNVSGGTVLASLIVGGGGNSVINVTNGTLAVTNTAGSVAAPINTLSISNAVLKLGIPATGASVTVTNLNLSTNNSIVILSVDAIFPSYPVDLPVIKYNTATGTNSDLFNVGLTLPAGGYTGFISNNLANSSIDVVLTGGPNPPRNITWSGNINGTWDINTTANWRSNATPTTYNDNGGQGGDFVTLNDSGAIGTITLAATVAPSSITFSNNTLKYTITDGGSGFALASDGLLAKFGSGTLVLDNLGGVTVAGGMIISNGTVQVGNSDGNGGVGSGAILDNGTLTISRNNAFTLGNTISGTGSLNVTGVLSTVSVNGANTFSGQTTIYSNNILKTGNASALGLTNGGTVVNYGASLDVNARNLGQEPVTVSGPGVLNQGDFTTNGAIYSSGGSITRALARVTMTGDTVIGAPSPTAGFGGGGASTSNRWDIGSAGGTTGDPSTASLLMNGSAHNLVKAGNNWIGIVSTTVDPLLGDIDIQSGTLDLEGNTTGLGNPSAHLYVRNTAVFEMFSATNKLNKLIQLDDGSTVTAGAGTDTIVGPMAVGGNITFNAIGNGTLILSNAVSGSGMVTKDGSNIVILAGTDTHTGGFTVVNGALVLNTTNLNTDQMTVGGIQGGAIAILGGNGTYKGAVNIEDTLWPGAAGKPSSLNIGNNSDFFDPNNGGYGGALVFGGASQSARTAIFSLNTATTTGGGTNDFVNVSGNLNNFGSQVYINPLTTLTSGGTYTLVNYSGTLNGTFGSTPAIYPALQVSPNRYKFTLTQSSGHVNLTVNSTAGALIWTNATGNGVWDATNSFNWFKSGTNDYFAQLDSVVFDDSIANITANTAITVSPITIPSGTNQLNLGLRPSSITVVSTNNNYTLSGSKISGSTGLLKKGPSTLTIGTLSNDFTGATVIAGGTVVVNATNALGAVSSSVTISNGATLDVGGPVLAASVIALGAKPIIVSGWGVSSNGAIINGGALQQINALQNITLTGDTAFGGPGDARGVGNPGRWDMRGGTPTLSTGGNAYNLYKVGTNQVSLVNVTVDPNLGDVTILGGEFGLEQGSTLGNPAKTVTVATGASLEFFTLINPLDKKIVVNGGNGLIGFSVVTNAPNIWFNSGVGYPTNVLVGLITITNGSVIVGGGGAGTLSNVVSGPGGLNIGGKVTLMSPNTYTGPTMVSNNGTLFLSGGASILSTPSIALNSGTIDVSARTNSTLTIVSGQTLIGVGTIAGSLSNAAGSSLVLNTTNGVTGRLTVTNNANLNGTTVMKLNASTGTNDLVSITGNLVLGGTLSVSNIAGTYTNGQSFKLFNAATYTTNYTAITPSTPGPSAVWDATGLGIDGTLRVIVTGPGTFSSKPTVLSFVLNGLNVSISGTNGQAGDAYYLLTSTNVALPLAQWTVAATNVVGSVGANGSFTFSGTNVIVPADKQQFYILSNTNSNHP